MKKNGFSIPESFFIEFQDMENFDFSQLKQNKKYILRPSVVGEDSNQKSYAGEFRSIYPLNKKEVVDYLSKDKTELKEKIFGIPKDLNLECIILQEFIEADLYGVYFTRDPNSVFRKGFYEIAEKNDAVTGGQKSGNKLSFFKELELRNIGDKLEKKFEYPQDIEFGIKDNDIYILQSRDITSFEENFYSFGEIRKINGVYYKLETLKENERTVFTYSVLKYFFRDLLYLKGEIYYKPFLRLHRKKISIRNQYFEEFIKLYKKYLRKKIKFNILKTFFPQKLDRKIISELFNNYSYSFDLFEKSNLDKKFDFDTNYLTRSFLKLEEIKYSAFKVFEELKRTVLNSNSLSENINYLTIEELVDEELSLEQKEKRIYEREKFDTEDSIDKKRIVFKKGIILNTESEKLDFERIYKGKLHGYVIDYSQLKENNIFEENVLIIESLNIDEIVIKNIDFIQAVIVRRGSVLSHPAIWLREHKIPSIINYRYFEDINLGDFFEIF